MEEKDLKRYIGYRILDDELRERLDEIRERCQEKFKGYLPGKYRGYRWKIEWGELRRMSIRKEKSWLIIPIDMILGKEEIDEKKLKEEDYE